MIYKHLEKYLVHTSELNDNIDKFSNLETIFCFDTESCFLNEELKFKYENKIKIKHNCNAARVWAWSLSNTTNDYVLYGECIFEFFQAIDKIAKARLKGLKIRKFNEKNIKEIKKRLKLKMFVHNLAWDIEFLKYYLLQNDYEYVNSKVKDLKKIQCKFPGKSFNVVENDNIVYGAKVNLKGEYITYTKKVGKEVVKIKEEVFSSIEFIDSYKILSFSLDSIAKEVIKVDEMFYKMGEEFDYNKIRYYNHKFSELEKAYIYNDVYILKEFIKQFYLPLNTNATTASGISFEKFLQGTYDETTSLYKQFLEDYPDLSYSSKIYKMIKKSYRGGWTQVNRKFKGVHLKNINGTSVDINSSYPSVIKYRPLPYGTPVLHENYVPCKTNELNLYYIEFNNFYNKNPKNLIGEIQCGSINREIFNRLGTEYLSTNIIDGVAHGTNMEGIDKRYGLYIWDFELENILENTVFENYKIINTLTFKCKTGHFKNVVEDYTKMKIEGKKIGNEVMTNFSKLVLNSFYGKLASRYERHERKIVLDNGLAVNERTDVYYETDKKYYPAFASCVTAWARVNLRTQLYKLGFENIIYFDTDSLYTTLPLEEVKEKMGTYAEYEEVIVNGKKEKKFIKILDEKGSLDPFELGKWDIEKTYTEFKAIGSKKYILKTTMGKIICKCAGLPSEVRNNQTFNDFYIGAIFSGKKVKTKLPGGYALIEGTYQLKDNIL